MDAPFVQYHAVPATANGSALLTSLHSPFADHEKDARAALELRGPLTPRSMRPAEREGVPLDLVDPRPRQILPTIVGPEIELLRALGRVDLELEFAATGRRPLVPLHHQFPILGILTHLASEFHRDDHPLALELILGVFPVTSRAESTGQRQHHGQHHSV